MSAGCKQARQFENLWLQGVHLRPLMAMPVLEIDFVHGASFVRERCLQNNLEIVRSHKHRKMREENALFSNNQHVMTRGFVSVIVRVWVHFHGVVMFLVPKAPGVASGGCQIRPPRVPEITDRNLLFHGEPEHHRGYLSFSSRSLSLAASR